MDKSQATAAAETLKAELAELLSRHPVAEVLVCASFVVDDPPRQTRMLLHHSRGKVRFLLEMVDQAVRDMLSAPAVAEGGAG
jgi:hypothetical protein